jgi:hypothetical protein
MNELFYGGSKYATPELAAKARRDAEASLARAQAAQAKRHADVERRVQDAYLAGGGTPKQWAIEKADILRAARKQAALTGDDAARRISASRYVG